MDRNKMVEAIIEVISKEDRYYQHYVPEYRAVLIDNLAGKIADRLGEMEELKDIYVDFQSDVEKSIMKITDNLNEVIRAVNKTGGGK